MASKQNICETHKSTNTENEDKKSKRSSILKPQKPRNPLVDVDFGNEENQDPDAVSRTLRRVSFAPSNLVKPFAQDPEKNTTIWDSTYEESIETSSDQSEPKKKEVPEVTILTEEDMNITSDVNKCIDDIVYCNSSIETDTGVLDNKIIETEVFYKNGMDDMEFTEMITPYVQDNQTVYLNTTIKTESNLIDFSETDMELTKVAGGENNGAIIVHTDLHCETEIIILDNSNKDTPHSTFHLSSGSCDDTEHLINYNISEKNRPKSDFSKILADGSDPTLLNPEYLPLNVNSDSFQVSVSNIASNQSEKMEDRTENIENYHHSEALQQWFTKCGLIIPKIYENVHFQKVKDKMELNLRLCDILGKKFQDLIAEIDVLSDGNADAVSGSVSSVSLDVSTGVDECLFFGNEILEPDLSLSEKIKKLHKRCDGDWNIISLGIGGIYKFYALYEDVSLTVKLNENNRVIHTELKEEADVTPGDGDGYCRKVFIERMQDKSLCSALGKNFDILSLLDYFEMIIQKNIEMRRKFNKLFVTYPIALDEDYRLRFSVVSIKLEQIWEFNFSILDLDKINPDMVEINIKMGNLPANCVRQCFKDCSKGLDFIENFLENAYNYMRDLEQRR